MYYPIQLFFRKFNFRDPNCILFGRVSRIEIVVFQTQSVSQPIILAVIRQLRKVTFGKYCLKMFLKVDFLFRKMNTFWTKKGHFSDQKNERFWDKKMDTFRTKK